MQRQWSFLSLLLMGLWLLQFPYACESRRATDFRALDARDGDDLKDNEIGEIIQRFIRLQDEEDARRWLENESKQEKQLKNRLELAQWDFTTNVNEDTQRVLLQQQEKLAQFMQSVHNEGRQYEYQNFRSYDLKRQFKMVMANADSSDLDKVNLCDSILSNMTSLYNTAKVCSNDVIVRKLNRGECLTLEPDLENILMTSRDPEVTKAVWKGWRDVAGKPQKRSYQQFISLLNEGARENGYSDYGSFWREDMFPDNTDVENMAAKLWSELRPLYLQLHAFVRRKLRKRYGADVVGKDGTIRADLLGNMWGQQWNNIYPLVVPFPGISEIDVNQALKDKYDVMGLFRLSEAYYRSLGLFNMTEIFWQKSMFTRPKDREVQCHASATSLVSPGDFRIKMCSEVSQEYLQTIHHEMGHVEYFMAYDHQPLHYQDGANCAFHEAIGDTIALSVMSPTHLRRLGLLGKETSVDESTQKAKTINSQMLMALEKIAFLPFGLLVDTWRWQVLDGSTTPDTYNRDWWQLRLDLQGLRAPIPRSEDDFDPAAKFHIAANKPYMCYFMSHVLQFQFHQQLCKLSGHKGPLHLCDIQDSVAAGKAFKRLLSSGSSRPWQDVLEEFTGSREVSAAALMEFFKPLLRWLKDDNLLHNEALGWPGATINWGDY